MEDARKTLLQDVRAKIGALLENSGLTLDEVYGRRLGGKTKAAKGSGALRAQPLHLSVAIPKVPDRPVPVVGVHPHGALQH